MEFYSRVGGNVPTRRGGAGLRGAEIRPCRGARRARRYAGPCLSSPSCTVTHEKADSLLRVLRAQGRTAQHQTHYCPGCGHGIVHKLLAAGHRRAGHSGPHRADQPGGLLGVRLLLLRRGQHPGGPRARARGGHGASSAAAPDSIVIDYQGDGDLAAIGTAEIVHAANRGEPITVIFVNNGIYGMTGGQMAPTTPLGKKSTTSPFGRNAADRRLPAARVRAAGHAGSAGLHRARGAGQQQADHAGGARSSGAPSKTRCTGWASPWWKCSRPAPPSGRWSRWRRRRSCARRWRASFRSATSATAPRRRRRAAAPPAAAGARRPAAHPGPGATARPRRRASRVTRRRMPTYRIKVAGFGGQGVLMLGEVLAEAGLDAGYEVSWLPSYGPEMRSGTSNCHVRLAAAADRFAAGLASQRAAGAQRAVAAQVPAGGGTGRPGALQRATDYRRTAQRSGVRVGRHPLHRHRRSAGAARSRQHGACSGALLEATGLLPDEALVRALHRMVRQDGWYELDRAALAAGREEARRTPVLAGARLRVPA